MTNELKYFPNDNELVDQNKPKEYTSDGRDRNKFSVVVKPDDEKYPNPDTTGNGVATSTEDYYQSNEKALQSKSMLNNIANLLLHIASMVTDTYSKIGCTDKDTFGFIGVLFRNVSHTNPPTKCSHSYVNSDFTINAALIKPLMDYLSKPFTKEYLLGSKRPSMVTHYTPQTLLNLYKIKTAKDFDTYKFNEVFGTNLQRVKDVYNDIVKIDNYFNSVIDVQKICKNRLKELKSILTTFDESEAQTLYDNIDCLYSYAHSLSIVVAAYCEDICKYFEMITPSAAKTRISIVQNSLMFNIDKLNPMISADYHLLREVLKGDRNDLSRSEGIINLHNKYVKPNDVFLFLGDISEEEFYEAGSDAIKRKLIMLCKRLNGRKIMIYGNNDTADIDFYHNQCGFVEVYKNPILTKKHGFSHGPIDTGNVLDIHGHIHGSKQYWGIDYHNHIDVFFGLWGQPVRLSYLDQKQTQQIYYNGCITKNKTPDFDDPEVVKTYSNQII